MREILFFILIIIFLGSCDDKLPDKNEVVQRIYESKKKNFFEKEKAKCYKELVKAAEEKLDSVIIKYVQADILDTVRFPKKPIKPIKPDHIIDKVSKFEIDTTGH